MIGSFLGSALGVAVVGALLRHWASKNLEEFRAAIAKAALEHGVRYTKVYERRFEVAEEVWAALVKADRALMGPADPMWRGQDTWQNDYDAFAQAADDFRETFNSLIIHFGDDVALKFEAYWQAMKSAGFATQRRLAENQPGSTWWESYSRAREKMEELKSALRRECQSLLGGPEPLRVGTEQSCETFRDRGA